MEYSQEWRTYIFLTSGHLHTQWRPLLRMLSRLLTREKKDVTEVAAKHDCKQGIKNDDMEPPMKNLDEEFDVRMLT